MEAADAWTQTGALYLSGGIFASRVGDRSEADGVGSRCAAVSPGVAAPGTAELEP
jgi:hypothetical protein